MRFVVQMLVGALSFCNYFSLLVMECLLLLSGDVELNPGPMNKAEQEQISRIEKMLQDVHAGQAQILAKLESIELKQKELENQLHGINSRVEVTEDRITRTEQREKAMMAKLDDLENRGRRSNLVFFGVPDVTVKETWETSEKLVSNVCRDVLGLKDISIERAHRIGAYKNGKTRPIVACFSSWKMRESVMHNATKFKGTDYSVSEDFSQAVQEKRRKLWNYAKEMKQNKDSRVYLNYDKLVIDGESFIWHSEKNEPVPVRKPKSTTLSTGSE